MLDKARRKRRLVLGGFKLGFIKKLIILVIAIMILLYYWNPLLLVSLLKIGKFLAENVVKIIIYIGSSL